MPKHKYVIDGQLKEIDNPDWIFGFTLQADTMGELIKNLVGYLNCAKSDRDELMEDIRKRNEQHQ